MNSTQATRVDKKRACKKKKTLFMEVIGFDFSFILTRPLALCHSHSVISFSIYSVMTFPSDAIGLILNVTCTKCVKIALRIDLGFLRMRR